MKINAYHGKYNIQKRTDTVKYIVLHYVGSGTSESGSAKNNCIYFSKANRNASAHYFVDDGGIWEFSDPKTYATWHCGDGAGRYGITNQNSIGIEVCIKGDNPYTTKEINFLKELVPYLMAKFNIKAENVVRHFDASRKQCPYFYARRPEQWEVLKKQITKTGTKPVTTTKPAASVATANVKVGQKGLNTFLKGTKNFVSLVIDGSRGPATKKAEIMAIQKGLNSQFGTYLDVDGSYGPRSKAVMRNRYAARGSKGDFVKAVQLALYTHGYSPKGNDGSFGPDTEAAVKAFQKDNKLTVDGSAGPKTIAKLLS